MDPVGLGMIGKPTGMSANLGHCVVPTENDIILGRGNLHASHPGNVRFYAILDEYSPLYEAAETRSDKTKVVQMIYAKVTSVGRFVKNDEAGSAGCVVVEPNTAKKKISHAIRFRLKGAAKKPPTSSGKFSSRSRASSSRRSNSQCNLAKQNKVKSHQIQSHQNPATVQDQPKAKNKKTCGQNESASDCIIPDDELSSVLLLPPHEMAMTARMYEDFLQGDHSSYVPACMGQALENSTIGPARPELSSIPHEPQPPNNMSLACEVIQPLDFGEIGCLNRFV